MRCQAPRLSLSGKPARCFLTKDEICTGEYEAACEEAGLM
jgi:hypothetical protein